MNIQQIYTQITKAQPNYRVRSSQLKMIEAVNDGFKDTNSAIKDGHNICLIEAPTGTGKSLAYTLSGIVNAKASGKKLVISTATKTLQSQLVEKDIPSFIKSSGIKFSVSVAKGRGNYLCPYQLELSLDGVAQDLFSETVVTRDALSAIQKQFQANSWDGDLDTAPIHIENKIRPLITTDKDRCIGYSCPYNQKDECKCPFYKNREKLRSAEVIVTNHSLLLADLMLGSGSVLPVKPDGYLLCIDEGHNFADSAINSFTGNFELKHLINTCHNFARLVFNGQTNSYISTDIALCDGLFAKINELIAHLDEFLILLNRNLEIFVDKRLILNEYLNPKLGKEFRDRFVNFALLASEIELDLSRIIDTFKEQIKLKQDYLIEANINRLGFYLSTTQRLLQTSEYIINQDDSRYNANARWIDIVEKKGSADFVIYAGLTHVGNILFNKLWSKVHAACVTSATLAIGEDFRYYLHKLGLNLYPSVATYKLPTCFSYANQAQIVVPKFKTAPEYSTRSEFDRELVTYLNDTLSYAEGYGTLVLFFNRTQLQDVYAKLSKPVQQRALLQTDYTSNQRLIDDHKKIINSGRPSVVFGLNSFAEGVDLPSLYCMHVIITKIPFETHKDPQNMVQEYWVNFEKNSYFMDVALPEAGIRLIQAAGRLIRDEHDYGQLTICDNRIIFKNYGGLLLNALPAFNRKYNNEFMQSAFAKISNT
jgi:ATP-dependent DNA helicase DinG